MTEKVAIGMATAAGMLLDIAVTNAKRAEHRGKLLFDVQLLVNGVEVPFAATAEEFVQRVQAQNAELVVVQASELVTAAGLHPALNALKQAQWHVLKALREVREKCPDDTPHVERV